MSFNHLKSSNSSSESEDIHECEKIFQLAEEKFKSNRYKEAENLLNQLVLKNYKKPHIFHMLGTISYDNGKFNKAIRSFRRALEIDPSFTDASVGLSILLNDLGRYNEGREVFEKARVLLKTTPEEKENSYLNEKLSIKHDELGHLYFQSKRYDEALTQYLKALSLSSKKLDIHLSVVNCFLLLGRESDAIYELKDLCKEHPSFIQARLKLGKIYYDKNLRAEAMAEWKEVLRQDPENLQLKMYLEKLNSTHRNQEETPLPFYEK